MELKTLLIVLIKAIFDIGLHRGKFINIERGLHYCASVGEVGYENVHIWLNSSLYERERDWKMSRVLERQTGTSIPAASLIYNYSLGTQISLTKGPVLAMIYLST